MRSGGIRARLVAALVLVGGIAGVSVFQVHGAAAAGGFTFRATPHSGKPGSKVHVHSITPCKFPPSSGAGAGAIEALVDFRQGGHTTLTFHEALTKGLSWAGTFRVPKRAKPGPASIHALCFGIVSSGPGGSSTKIHDVYTPVVFDVLGPHPSVSPSASVSPSVAPNAVPSSIPSTPLPQGARLVAVSASSATNAFAVGSFDDGRQLIEHWDGTTWRPIALFIGFGLPSSKNVLTSVSTTSPTDAWVAGADEFTSGGKQGAEPFLEHWDGHTWSALQAPLPAPGDFRPLPGPPPGQTVQGATSAWLSDVAAVSPTDVWVVGYAMLSLGCTPSRSVCGGTVQRGFIEHWDGTKWSLQPATLLGPGSGQFTGVAALSSTTAWAVGSDAVKFGGSETASTLVEQLAGGTWSREPITPVAAGANESDEMFDVAAASPTAVWAVGLTTEAGRPGGRAFIDAFNGHGGWDPQLQEKGTILRGVAAASPTSAWAVGGSFTGKHHVIEHWNGTGWSLQSSPTPGSADGLTGVAAAAPNDAWAVGSEESGGVTFPLIEHWDGTRWSIWAVRSSGHRSRVAGSLPTPGDLSYKPVHVATNVSLALLLLILVSIPAELFNHTFREHYDEIVRWRLPRALGLPPRDGSVAPPPVRRLGARVASFAGIMVVTSLLIGFVDPSFGFNETSLALFLGLVLGLTAVTAGFGALDMWYMRRRHMEHGFFRGYPAALVVVAVSALVSRLGHFLPGYIIGAIAGFTFLKPLDERERGRRAAFTTASTLVSAIVVWVVRTPVAHAAAKPGASLLVIILEAVMVAIIVAGIERTALGMLPIRFLPGESVRRWNRRAWAALGFAGMLALVSILINPYGNVIRREAVGPVIALVGVMVGLSAFCVGFWWYFRRRDALRESTPAG